MAAKRIVIIGGGVSGLVAGIYARKQGFAAAVYEKNPIPGGECTGWDRDGYHIDNCIHWLMGAKPGSDLYDIWRTVGALGEDVPLVPLTHMYASELGNERITLWKDMERTRREMLALSPADAKEINALLKACAMTTGCGIPAGVAPELMDMKDGLRLMKQTAPMLKLMGLYKNMDTADLQARFEHPLLRAVLADFCTPDMPGSSFPMAYGNFICGDGGLPRGGSRAFARRIADRFTALGGKLYLNKSAESFTLDGGRVQQLVLADGERVEGDYFIPACDPDFLFHHMLDESYMDEVFTEVYHDREAYPIYSMFQAAFAVDSPVDALHGDVNLEIEPLAPGPRMGKRMCVKIYPYEPDFAPRGKQVMTVLYGGGEDWYDFWAALYADPAAYKAQKRAFAGAMQARIEARFPEYAGKLRLLDSWSPMTYKRYCNAFKGYNQAYAITKNSRKNPYPSPYLKGLDNVVLSGQWLSAPGGLPGAAITGKYAIQRVCKKEGLPLVK